MSKTQLQTSVCRLAAAMAHAPIASVSCQLGLEGRLGVTAYCDVTAAGSTTLRIVDVTAVSGLQMNYGLVPVLPKGVVESSLISQLRQTGQHPDTATCAGDLKGKVGDTVGCTTQTAGQAHTYVLTATAVSGDDITYKYGLKT